MNFPLDGDAPRSLGKRISYRLFWAFVAFGAGAGFSFYHKQTIFLWLIAPAGGKLSPFDGLPIYTSPIAMIGSTISVVSKVGFAAAFPVLVYGVLTLLKPLLPERFYKFLWAIIIAAVASYLAGAAFVYFVMLPVGLGFLLSFGEGIAVPVIDITEYLALLAALMFAMGLVFLIPIGMFLLAKMNLVKYRHFKVGRWFVPLFAGFLGIILTPTADGINFLMVGLPVLLLYEFGLFSTWVIATEEGNYLWLRTLGRMMDNVRWRLCRLWHMLWDKPWSLVRWVVRRPLVGYRWVRRKFK